jgi:hypothetical protein
VSYRVTLIDRAEREARIRRSLGVPTRFDDFYEFRGAKTSLKVVRLPNDLPIYRMENYRAFSDQSEYMAREHKNPDYFRTGQENETVQQVQHEILAKLAARGKANSVIPIIDVLQREGQREHLLITNTGVVVNGNRRLAAMRELHSQDASAYEHFGHVDCMVLPADTTSDDILEIEGKLQARPETRLDYDWVGDAQLLAAMLRVKGTPEAVAKTLNRKPAEVRNALQALTEAEMYLREWVGAEGEYGRVSEEGEQLFKDLPGQLQGKSAELQDASRAIAWSLFENRRKLEGRLYNYNVVFGKRAADVLDRLSDELGIALTSSTDAESDSDYDFEVDADSSVLSYSPVLAALKSNERKEDAFEALSEICIGVIEAEKSQRNQGAALKAISTANARLAEVDLTRASPSTYDAMDRQLGSIIDRATQLRGTISRLRNRVAEKTDGE